ncbi:hypothetical protein BDF14DRAFT_1827384 [Spinellus fusiger]|nr:hypothetical protein BDF14DRAFT_1827384 [Spinellus fusiger]
MSKRFQNLNKYRNSVGKLATRESSYVDLPLGTSPSSHCDLIQASRQWIALKWNHGSGSMGLLSLDKVGKGCVNNATVFHAHGAAVSDWCFSEFNDSLLATGGEDGLVKLWNIPVDTTAPICLTTTTTPSRRVDIVRFHPTASQLMTTLGNDGKEVCLWDIEKSNIALKVTTEKEPFHSFSWKSDGTLLGTSAKGAVQLWDPRGQETRIESASGHEGMKGSRIVWLGNSSILFTVGTNKFRSREYALWDARQMAAPLKISPLDTSSGSTIPLYDQDTETMYMISRGDATVRSLQFSDSITTPSVEENLACGTSVPVYGATLLPKACLDVMQAEVARVLLVTENTVVPITYQVPRKQYLDFHSDLFPETRGCVPALSGSEWLAGKNGLVATVTLDPSKHTKKTQTQTQTSDVHVSAKPSVQSAPVSTSPIPIPEETVTKPAALQQEKTVNEQVKLETHSTPLTSSSPNIKKENTTSDSMQQKNTPTVSKTTNYSSVHASFYKYLSGKVYHPSTHFDDLRGLSVDKSGDIDLIKTNTKFIAVPIAGPGGRVGIISSDKPGRLPIHIPSVLCNSEVTNFQFDPFHQHLLSTVSEDSKIRLWTIPQDGLEEDLGEPTAVLSSSSMNKINLMEYHPNTQNILITASNDFGKPTLRIWDLQEKKEKITLSGMHTDVIFSVGWSPEGRQIATLSKDKKIRILDARSGEVVAEGPAHDSMRPSKLLWLGESNRIASVGFGRGSMREILLFDTKDLSRPLSRNNIDVSPSVMNSYYDVDCSVLYVAGKGDRTIHTYELENNSTFKPLAKIEASTLQQGFAFFPKRLCNVHDIEIAKFYRLTPTTIELVGVHVPRARPEYFQDDIYIDTLDTENPAQNATSWFNGEDMGLKKVSLQPKDMSPLSLAPPPPQVAKSKQKFELGKKTVTEEQQRQELMDRMFSSAKEIEGKDEPERNDEEQEVADDEWDD